MANQEKYERLINSIVEWKEWLEESSDAKINLDYAARGRIILNLVNISRDNLLEAHQWGCGQIHANLKGADFRGAILWDAGLKLDDLIKTVFVNLDLFE